MPVTGPYMVITSPTTDGLYTHFQVEAGMLILSSPTTPSGSLQTQKFTRLQKKCTHMLYPQKMLQNVPWKKGILKGQKSSSKHPFFQGLRSKVSTDGLNLDSTVAMFVEEPPLQRYQGEDHWSSAPKTSWFIDHGIEGHEVAIQMSLDMTRTNVYEI